MSRLNWNFASQRHLRGKWIAFWVIASLACVHALVWRYDLLQQRDQALATLNDVPQQTAHPDHRSTPAQTAVLGTVFSELHSPWIEMLDSLQRATHPGVELISLEPDSSAVKRVHISGVASRAQDVFELVEALQGDRSWSAVQLVTQATTQDGNIPASKDIPTLPSLSPSGVSFSLLAEWAHT
jgi:hypothetical protein